MQNESNTYTIKAIGKEQNKNMLEILRESPINSKGLTICFDRQPDIFITPELNSEKLQTIGLFKAEKLVGFVMMLYQNVYVNGKPQLVMYYCNMHVKNEARRKGFFYKASDYVSRDPYKNSNLGCAIVMKGNKAAERFISKRKAEYPNIPYSKIIGELHVKNIMITFRKNESTKYHIRGATMADVDDIIVLLKEEFSPRLFAPVMDKKIFLNNLAKRPDFDISNYYVAEQEGKIVGVCAAWDTCGFKQNRIIRYGKKLKVIKIFHTIFARLFGLPHLPQPGKAIKDATITEYAVKERNPEILEALLVKIYNEYQYRKYNMLIFGSCANDPLLQATKRFFTQPVVSNIILFSKDESFLNEGKIDASLPYIDLVML